MKIAINTPTGNIGRVLAANLLDAGEELVLLTRSPEKTKEFAERGATVRTGDLTDRDFVVSATKGVDALFWLTAAAYDVPDLRAAQNHLSDNAVAAIKDNNIARVVTLSSAGAQLSEATGPILGLHDAETKVEGTGAAVTHLRPNFFMENYFMSVATIASDGAVYLPVPGSIAMPYIATMDIAAVAADVLRDTSWSGRNVIELCGPDMVTFDEGAAAIGEAIGKDVQHVVVTPEQAKGAMLQMGIGEDAVDRFLEMYDGFATERIQHETEPRSTSTDFATFLENAFVPAYRAMTG